MHNNCRHDMWYAGVIDNNYCSNENCKCLDCGFERVINVDENGLDNIVTVNKCLNDFKPITYEMVKNTYQEMKKKSEYTAKILIKRKYR